MKRLILSSESTMNKSLSTKQMDLFLPISSPLLDLMILEVFSNLNDHLVVLLPSPGGNCIPQVCLAEPFQNEEPEEICGFAWASFSRKPSPGPCCPSQVCFVAGPSHWAPWPCSPTEHMWGVAVSQAGQEGPRVIHCL